MSYPKVLVRSEQSSGRIGVVESVMPAGAAGPPLHKHDFDEAFYVLDGELTFHLGGDLITVGAGQLAFAPGGEPHTLANRGAAAARFLIAFTPAGFERQFARRAARSEGVDPPDWALQEIPPVTRVGPRIGEEEPGQRWSWSTLPIGGRHSRTDRFAMPEEGPEPPTRGL